MKKKIDDYYRILIPSEIRAKLNWTKGTELKFTVEDNELILTKSENDPDLIVDDQKVEVHDKKYEELSDKSKSYLQQKIEEVFNNKNETKNNINQISLSEIKCSKCGDYIDVNMNMKLNDSPICRKCANLLKEELKQDILYNKRIKDIQSKLDY